MGENPGPSKPIPLSVGLYLTAIATVLFVGVYGNAGDTTTRGWLATFAVALEFAGVLLVASPELRPRVEQGIAWFRDNARHVVQGVILRLRRLFGDRTQTVQLGTAVSASATMGIEVQRGFGEPPADDAPLEQKVEYLLRQDQRFKDLFNVIENQALQHIKELREELDRTASDISKQTAESVRQLAESELRMRLLGVVCIVAGVGFSYAANIA